MCSSVGFLIIKLGQAVGLPGKQTITILLSQFVCIDSALIFNMSNGSHDPKLPLMG